MRSIIEKLHQVVKETSLDCNSTYYVVLIRVDLLMSCHRWCRIFKKCIDKIVVLQHMYYFFTLLRRVLMTSKFYYWIWTEKWQRLYYFFIRSLIFSGQDLSIYDNLGPQKYTLLSSGLWNLVTKLSRFCLENKYSERKVIYFVN